MKNGTMAAQLTQEKNKPNLKLLYIADVAERLGISKCQAWRLRKRGLIKGIDTGRGRHMITESSLIEFVCGKAM